MLVLPDWQNFYLLTGTAAATLIGLLFVAISLGSNLPLQRTQNLLQTFVTPILVSYFQVLLLACLAIMPLPNRALFAGALALLGGGATALTVQVLWRMRVLHRADEIDRGHWIWHFLIPLLAGFLLLTTAYGLLLAEPLAALGLAVTQLLGLTIGLRNTWVLMIWLSLRRAPPGPAAKE